MKRPAPWHFFAQLPLPILAAWFVASQPAGAGFIDQLPTAVAWQADSGWPGGRSAAAPAAPQYPPPQAGESSPTEGPPPTFSNAFHLRTEQRTR